MAIAISSVNTSGGVPVFSQSFARPYFSTGGIQTQTIQQKLPQSSFGQAQQKLSDIYGITTFTKEGKVSTTPKIMSVRTIQPQFQTIQDISTFVGSKQTSPQLIRTQSQYFTQPTIRLAGDRGQISQTISFPTPKVEKAVIERTLSEQNQARYANYLQTQRVNQIRQQTFGQAALGYGSVYNVNLDNEKLYLRDISTQLYDPTRETTTEKLLQTAGIRPSPKSPTFTFGVTFTPEGKITDNTVIGSPRIAENETAILKRLGITLEPTRQQQGLFPTEYYSQTGTSKAGQASQLEVLPRYDVEEKVAIQQIPFVPITQPESLTEDQMKQPQKFVSQYPTEYSSQADKLTKNIDRAAGLQYRAGRGRFGTAGIQYGSQQYKDEFIQGLTADPEKTLIGSAGVDISKRIKGQDPTAVDEYLKTVTPYSFGGELLQYVLGALPIKGIPLLKPVGTQLGRFGKYLAKPFLIPEQAIKTKGTIYPAERNVGAYTKRKAIIQNIEEGIRQDKKETDVEKNIRQLIKESDERADNLKRQANPLKEGREQSYIPDSFQENRRLAKQLKGITGIEPPEESLTFGQAEKTIKGKSDIYKITEPSSSFQRIQNDIDFSRVDIREGKILNIPKDLLLNPEKLESTIGKSAYESLIKTGEFSSYLKRVEKQGLYNIDTGQFEKFNLPKTRRFGIEGDYSETGNVGAKTSTSVEENYYKLIQITQPDIRFPSPKLRSEYVIGTTGGLGLAALIYPKQKDLELPVITSRFDEKSRDRFNEKQTILPIIDVSQLTTEDLKISEKQIPKQAFSGDYPQIPFQSSSQAEAQITIPQFGFIQPPKFASDFYYPTLPKIYGFGGTGGFFKQSKGGNRIFKVFDVPKIPAGIPKIGLGYYEISLPPNFEIKRKRKTSNIFFNVDI